MTKWEYKFKWYSSANGSTAEEDLIMFGNEGWEMVGFAVTQVHNVAIYFKRRKRSKLRKWLGL